MLWPFLLYTEAPPHGVYRVMTLMHGRSAPSRKPPSLWSFIVVTGCLVLVLVALISRGDVDSHGSVSGFAAAEIDGAGEAATLDRARRPRRRPAAVPAPTPEEIVASKVRQFGQSRRQIVRAMASRTNKGVPDEVERFFDAIEEGNWDKIDALWQAMARRSGQYEGSGHDPKLNEFWPAVLEAYGAAEQAHLWPAQKLLDYGNSILGSLRPGMVYVGGTDEGRFVPTLLNETSGEQRIVITQNALADGRYLDYVNFVYGDRFTALSKQDSERIFSDYIKDAQQRLLHDQQFPDQPKQIRPGEDVRMVDGKVQVSGRVAVMTINEGLLKALMEKNPDLSFAVQESFPFQSTYGDAAPLGPVMELNAQDGQNALTAERAAQSVEYWRSVSDRLLSDPEAAGSETTLKSYAHLAVGQANLFAAGNFASEAEQAYKVAAKLWPGHPDATFNLAKLFAGSGRTLEAQQLLNEFAANFPDKGKAVQTLRATLFTGPGQ